MFDLNGMQWTNRPEEFSIDKDTVTLVTKPVTGLWNSTFYDYDDATAHMLMTETEETSFSFSVKAECNSRFGYDGGGVVLFADEKNWLKAAAEYGDEKEQYMGSVLTTDGYSDWASHMIPGDIKTIWYRLSRIGADFVLECSYDGEAYEQMRMFHLKNGEKTIKFGIFACSPDESSFRATFTEFKMEKCVISRPE